MRLYAQARGFGSRRSARKPVAMNPPSTSEPRYIGRYATPLHLVTTIMAGVLHGLHAAHEARTEQGEALSIVHRDVSPQNVLVGIDGVPRVLDFGVAKAAHRAHATREGQVKGKIAYMAPEQLRSDHVDRRCDVYAASRGAVGGRHAQAPLPGRHRRSGDGHGAL